MNDFRGILPLFYDFYIVAKENSITKAAINNFVSQPSLTRSIQKLENELNLTLLNRNNKGISLTLDGEKLYKKLDEIFNNLDNKSLSELSNLKGTLTIGTTRNIADNKLNVFLSKFYEKYPSVKINIITDSATNLNEYLLGHKIDILIDYLPHINYSSKFELEVKAIGQFKTVFACSCDFYKKISKNIISLESLNKYKLIIPGKSRRRQLLDEFLQSKNITLNPIVEMPDSKLMADFIKQNECIGYFIEEEADYYGLAKLSNIENLPINSIGLIYAKNTINEIGKKFVETVIDNIEK